LKVCNYCTVFSMSLLRPRSFINNFSLRGFSQGLLTWRLKGHPCAVIIQLVVSFNLDALLLLLLRLSSLVDNTPDKVFVCAFYLNQQVGELAPVADHFFERSGHGSLLLGTQQNGGKLVLHGA